MSLLRNITDTEYKGFDITIYELNESDFILDIKKPCGELIAGWEYETCFDEAMAKGINFIDEMVSREVIHA